MPHLDDADHELNRLDRVGDAVLAQTNPAAIAARELAAAAWSWVGGQLPEPPDDALTVLFGSDRFDLFDYCLFTAHHAVTPCGPRYRYDRLAIASALELMLERGTFVFEQRELVTAAVSDFETGAADFADYLIGRKNLDAGESRLEAGVEHSLCYQVTWSTKATRVAADDSWALAITYQSPSRTRLPVSITILERPTLWFSMM